MAVHRQTSKVGFFFPFLLHEDFLVIGLILNILKQSYVSNWIGPGELWILMCQAGAVRSLWEVPWLHSFDYNVVVHYRLHLCWFSMEEDAWLGFIMLYLVGYLDPFCKATPEDLLIKIYVQKTHTLACTPLSTTKANRPLYKTLLVGPRSIPKYNPAEKNNRTLPKTQ